MSGTGNRARGESAGGKLNQLIQKLPYHIIGIAGAERAATKGLTSKGKALLIFHEGGTKFPPRPAGRKKNSKKTREREKGERIKWR